MKLREISGMFTKIYNFNRNQNYILGMLEALDEDLDIDRYQDTQPGGGNCVYKNRKKYEYYCECLHALSPDELFGNLYKHGTNEEKQLLDYLILLVDQSPNYLDSPADNILYDSIPFYIIDTVVDNDLIIANENLTKKLLNKIFSTGKVLDKNIIGYDSDCEKMIYKMDITYEILKCIENSERNITLNDICSELEKKSYIPKLFKK